MDLKKKMAFNSKMSLKRQYPRHVNMMAKGGVVRKNFDTGGGVLGSIGGAFQGVAGDFTAQNQYGAQNAPTTQYDYGNAINQAQQNALGATAQTNNILAQQQALANQYQGVANGTGPNPALAALNQSTGQNVANQGALMAGQRGAGSNVGLIAREAAQQGAATQQQAAGQAATMQSQQQLNALGAIGQQQQNMANTNINQQNANTSLFGAGASANNAQNNTNVSNYGMSQGINAQVNQNNANAVNQTNSGLLGGVGSVLGGIGGAIGLAEGGLIPGAEVAAEPSAPDIKTPTIEGKLATKSQGSGGGASKSPTMPDTSLTQPELGSQFAPNESGMLGVDTSLSGAAPASGAGMLGVDTSLAAPAIEAATLAHGGKVHANYHPKFFHEYFSGGGMSGGDVPALVSAKEVYLGPDQVKEVVERGADPMKIGHHFPGKDKVHKDSRKNDVIPTTLKTGGVVLPIHITTHKDASEKGRKFVMASVAKHMKRPQGVK